MGTIRGFTEGCLIMGGDLTVALDPSLDTSSATSSTPHHVINSINTCLWEHQLVDYQLLDSGASMRRSCRTRQKFSDDPSPLQPATILLRHTKLRTSIYKKSLPIRILNVGFPLYWKQECPPPMATWFQRMLADGSSRWSPQISTPCFSQLPSLDPPSTPPTPPPCPLCGGHSTVPYKLNQAPFAALRTSYYVCWPYIHIS
ncbi:Hypothetical predicted protein [Pelobates cultripes]|uniref:Uncharacterized protein n=1 Tax=Pelobates cultripes TaxID=61616 RepID=A0AAD1R058_PELCU|nr:Hypothetical predicted protein [Pelobates cultripes]